MSDRGFVRPASRAGIHVNNEATIITRLEDVSRTSRRAKSIDAQAPAVDWDDFTPEINTSPGSEPLGAAPVPISVASKMIAFFAPKGGTGATTLAVNVGGALAALGRPAIVVDIDLQLGSVATSLNVKPERSIAEVMDEADKAGSGPITSGLDRHASGLSLLAQDRIEELGQISAERLPRFFDALGSVYQFVLVDGLRDFSDHAVATMDLAHSVVIVISQDVPAVRAAGRALRLFRRLGYDHERIKLVVNRFHKKSPVTISAIESALGQPVEAVVRNDFRTVELALNHGVMVADVRRNGAIAKDVDSLALELTGIAAGASASGGNFFARLFGRGR